MDAALLSQQAAQQERAEGLVASRWPKCHSGLFSTACDDLTCVHLAEGIQDPLQDLQMPLHTLWA